MTLLVLENAMGHVPFVITIQKFLGSRVHIFATFCKLWHRLYTLKTGITKYDMFQVKTRVLDMLESVSLLELARDYGLDLDTYYIYLRGIPESLTEETKANCHLAWWAGKIAPEEVVIRYGELQSQQVRHMYNGAAYAGRLDIIKQLYEIHGCQFRDNVGMEAACSSTSDVLEWLSDKNIGMWDDDTVINMMVMAATVGSIDVVEFLHEDKGVELLPAVPSAAASHGQVNFLRWMLEKYSWVMSKKTCLNAAQAKKPDALQWLKENQVGKWDKESLQGMLRCAAKAGAIETASWLLECGAGWDDTIVLAAVSNNQIDFVKWCKGEGCPWGDIDCLKLSKSGAHENTFDHLHNWQGWDRYKCDCGGCLRGLNAWGGELCDYSEFSEKQVGGDENDESP